MVAFVHLLCFILPAIALQFVEGCKPRKDSITDICNASSPLVNRTLCLIGDEDLSINKNCHVENAVNLTIQGLPETRPTIWCSRKGENASSTAFIFHNTHSLTIKNINFVGCGGSLNFSNSSLFFFSEGQAVIILCTFCFNFSLINVSFSVNSGYAFAGINLWGHSILEGISVNGKDDPHLPLNATICEKPEFKYTCGVRGIVLVFVDSGIMIEEDSRVLIKDSNFDYNHYAINKASDNFDSLTCIYDVFTGFIEPLGKSYVMPDVGALTIVQAQRSFKAYVKVLNSKFTNNRGLCFGAVLAVITTPSSSLGELIFKNCHFSNNTLTWHNYPVNEGKNYVADDITIQMLFNSQSRNSKCVSLINSSFSCSADSDVKNACVTLTHFPGSQG